MAITGAERGVDGPVRRMAPEDLGIVRRFEAAGFRAWPATSIQYDGTWAIRLTASHPAKRLNSVNPLDPADVRDITGRIARAAPRFEAYGRDLVLRLSPLAGEELSQWCDAQGWERFGESIVMIADMGAIPFEDAMDQLPVRDVARFSAAHLAVRGLDASMRAGISEVVNAIEPETGLFLAEKDGQPVTTAICVHDGDLAGLFEVATAAAKRGQGHARNTVLSALKWARLRGARTAWLQVETGNYPAVALYNSIGFRTLYFYHYRKPAEQAR
ncbi:GNAT family N-acetyltransferase [Zhengella sp.]|uniref:GNAT family N-acetyltransferase n=1 Tax=Zhengella sp. TaxID=2282762 RepID=UPI00352894FB